MKVCIVGAGISGLAAARALKAVGHQPVIFEKNDHVGGRVATRKIGEYVFDPGASDIAVGCLAKPYTERQLTKAIGCVDRHLQGQKVKPPKGLELFIAVSEPE